ncbi:DoxX family protein [Virgibacillus ndiopensis]|uniref:DoxX family protein n=1 Tax=Virgibacillus ndiopensis TaxID=2004408 RepID=UPI000C088AF9|nr:DoxX family protein [Virgibacillus ndiopensis]
MTIASYVLQNILTAIFLIVSLQKIVGHRQQVNIFKNLKLPQWFRIVTGWVELIGVVGLIIGFWVPWVVAIAGIWFGITMLVGSVTHIRVGDPIGKAMPAILLLVISMGLTTLTFSELQSVFS